MSNKSKSRKKREKRYAELLDGLVKITLAANIVANCMIDLKKQIQSATAPKFAPGGLVSEINNFYEENKEKGVPVKFYRDGVQISGGEAIIPVISKGTAPYENDQYMFQED